MIDLPEKAFSVMVRERVVYTDISIQRSSCGSGWILVATGRGDTDQSYLLTRQRGGPRVFRSLDSAVSYIESLGKLIKFTARVLP